VRSFWAGFIWTATVWTIYLIGVGEAAISEGGLLGCVAFFACYFLSDLFRRNSFIYMLLVTGSLLSSLIVSALTYEASADDTAIWFALLMCSYLMWRSFTRLTRAWAIAFCLIGTGSLIILTILVERWPLLPYVATYAAAFLSVSVLYRQAYHAQLESTTRYDALLDEYRQLKRNVKHHEDAARSEERTHIARKIHDSVGHKLTSLLMQLEVFRMQAEGDVQAKADQMKRLAQESLQETRIAVKALQEEEPGGMQALMRLIRNLETENAMQIEFVVRHGALSVSLDNDQSVAVYRAIQEALTNAMRHGSSRKMNILLESPGGSVFRFEVSNETADDEDRAVVSGFGLTAMRDRLEQAGGTLEVYRLRHQFIVRGTFMLQS